MVSLTDSTNPFPERHKEKSEKSFIILDISKKIEKSHLSLDFIAVSHYKDLSIFEMTRPHRLEA